MRFSLRKWLLSRVVKSALAFERESIELYRGMRERLKDSPLHKELEHLLNEEETHWKILADAAEGRLDPEELERILNEHLYSELPSLAPLAPDALGTWGSELSKALEREKETFIFYSNLQRMSKIPVVRKAFGVLAAMEKEHVDILSRLLGRH
jgi:rubrerythrin